jgi:hypothetical protein
VRVLWPDGDGEALGSLLEGFGDGDIAMRRSFREEEEGEMERETERRTRKRR